jgi:hypothetical protein
MKIWRSQKSKPTALVVGPQKKESVPANETPPFAIDIMNLIRKDRRNCLLDLHELAAYHFALVG